MIAMTRSRERSRCWTSLLSRFAVGIALLAVVGACAKKEPDPGPWPQWRGVGGQGISTEAASLPVSWTGDSGIRWSTELPGEGISSPIVGPGTVYVTADEAAGENRLFSLLAIDMKSGDIRWTRPLLERGEETLHLLNRAAAATPATDGQHIYVYLGSHLGAVDLDGNVLWLEEIDPDYLEHSRYGTGSSLVLTDDLVIVFQDLELWEDGTGWIAGFRKSDGERMWITEWDDSCCSYTTPILLDFAGETELLVSHARKISSYRASTGEVLWEREQIVNQPVASPVKDGDLLCSASGAHGVREIGCWRLAWKDGERSVERLWSEPKGAPATASPLLFNGLFFTVHEKGIIGCYDPETGQRLWQKRLPRGGYHSSPVAADGKIYAVNHLGIVAVVAASPTFELLGESQLPEGNVVASPAIADGCLLVRTDKHLYCVDGGTEDGEESGDQAPAPSRAS